VSQQFRYRPNVAAIVQRHDGKILIGERSDVPGAWQFPQGGVKKSETVEQALARELKEEISLEPGTTMSGVVRDALLFVSGQLNEEMGGPGFRPFTVQIMNSHFYTLTDPLTRVTSYVNDPVFGPVVVVGAGD
jgi:8-oxo-dGTP pyrophosphatase MutT (NUDIX family)